MRVVGAGLVRPCRVTSESLAVGVSADEPSFVHPDVAVLCGPSEVHPDEPTVVMNPAAVFEVLSPGTSVRDWNVKLPKYKAIASMETIAHVEHRRRRITVFLRTHEGWEEVVREEGAVRLRALGVDLDVGALYDEGVADGGP